MKVEFINPFIESVYEMFTTMLACEAKRGDVNIGKPNPSKTQEVVAMIGLSGPVRGNVAMSFPSRTAQHMVSRLLGVETMGVDETVLDAMSEMVNIVAGGAKARLNGDVGSPINLSLPTVVQGRDYRVDYPSWAVWLDVPFTSELGPFNLRVIFESNAMKKGENS